MTADTYNKVFTAHGVIMVFFFLVPVVPSVLGNFCLPLMIGAVLASVVSGRLMTKVPYRNIFAVSMVLPALAFFLMTTIDMPHWSNRL